MDLTSEVNINFDASFSDLVYDLLKHWPASKAMATRRPIVKAPSQPRLIFLPSRKRSESFYAAAAVQFKERYSVTLPGFTSLSPRSVDELPGRFLDRKEYHECGHTASYNSLQRLKHHVVDS